MDEKLSTLKSWMAESNNIVFFGGAGVSTESGIPDFRSVDGLYSQTYDYPPETILSRTFFTTRPDEFYRFYKDKMNIGAAAPNAAHLRLAELEREGRLQAVVTQNIDGLHQAAGSKNVLELHGSIHRNYCVKCKAKYSYDDVLQAAGTPRCHCGGIIRPDVVLYEEGLDSGIMNAAARYIMAADMLIVGGTSLVVHPAAGLVKLYSRDRFVLINKGETPEDSRANLIIGENIGEVFAQL